MRFSPYAFVLVLTLSFSLLQACSQAQDPYPTEITSPSSRSVRVGNYRALFEISTMQSHHTMMERMGITSMDHASGATHVLSTTIVDNQRGQTLLPENASFRYRTPEMQQLSEPVPAMRMVGGGMGHLTLDLVCKESGNYQFEMLVQLDQQEHQIPVRFENLTCDSHKHAGHH